MHDMVIHLKPVSCPKVLISHTLKLLLVVATRLILMKPCFERLAMKYTMTSI